MDATQDDRDVESPEGEEARELGERDPEKGHDVGGHVGLDVEPADTIENVK